MLVDALDAEDLDDLDDDALDAQQEQDNHLSLVFPRGKGKRHTVYVHEFYRTPREQRPPEAP